MKQAPFRIRNALAAVMLAAVLSACGAGEKSPQMQALSESAAQDLARAYYAKLAVYDFEGMSAATTPEFEAIEHNGTSSRRMKKAEFEERLKGAQAAGATLKFDLSDFKTSITPTAAFLTYIETSGNGRQYYAGMNFIRSGDAWLADELFTLPISQPPAEGAEASPAPSSPAASPPHP